MNETSANGTVPKKHDPLLRTALVANVFFSLLNGFLLIWLEKSFQTLFGLSYPFADTGYQLLFFALMVAFAAFHPRVLRKYIMLIIFLDGLWVLFCLVVLFYAVSISMTGKVLVSLSAMIVAVFGYYQYLGLKRSKK